MVQTTMLTLISSVKFLYRVASQLETCFLSAFNMGKFIHIKFLTSKRQTSKLKTWMLPLRFTGMYSWESSS
jgi:hypothetical protein